jgi:hypothetical protein
MFLDELERVTRQLMLLPQTRKAVIGDELAEREQLKGQATGLAWCISVITCLHVEKVKAYNMYRIDCRDEGWKPDDWLRWSMR